MRHGASRLARLALAFFVLTWSLSGCSVVTGDVDDLQRSELGEYQSLTLQLRSMGIHRNEVFEYRIVNDREGSANDNLLRRGVRTPLGQDDEDIVIADTIPRDGTTRIDFYADHNAEPGYQAQSEVGVDHGWSIPLSADNPNPAEGVAVSRDKFSGDWNILFEHQFEFTTLTELAMGRDDFKIVFSNTAAINGAPVTVRLRFNDRVIGSHRCLPDHVLVEQAWAVETALVIPDIVDTTIDPAAYSVDVYVDFNRNGQYDDPAQGGDLGWRLTDLSLQAMGDFGMIVSHDLASAGSNIDVGL